MGCCESIEAAELPQSSRRCAAWADGFFDGDWSSGGYPEGTGKLAREDGSFYEGAWLRGVPNGNGTAKESDGSSYQGEWKGGKCEGQGTWRGSDGESYTGEWLNGRAHGRGRWCWPNGESYEGQCKLGVKHGYGKYFYSTGETWEGTWDMDKKCSEKLVRTEGVSEKADDDICDTHQDAAESPRHKRGQTHTSKLRSAIFRRASRTRLGGDGDNLVAVPGVEAVARDGYAAPPRLSVSRRLSRKLTRTLSRPLARKPDRGAEEAGPNTPSAERDGHKLLDGESTPPHPPSRSGGEMEERPAPPPPLTQPDHERCFSGLEAVVQAELEAEAAAIAAAEDAGRSPRVRLCAFYEQFNPQKLTEVDALLLKYRGREEALFRKLNRKYGVSGAPTCAVPTINKVTERSIGTSSSSSSMDKTAGSTAVGTQALAPASAPSDESSEHRARLVAFYQNHNPSKLSEVSALLEKYRGREGALFRKLEKKYSNHR